MNLFQTITISQGVDFLHENRIAHCDLIMQNIGLNMLIGSQKPGPHIHNPVHAKYTIFDFGESLIYPVSMSLDDVIDPREYVSDGGNPFPGDVLSLGIALWEHVQVSRYHVISIGAFT